MKYVERIDVPATTRRNIMRVDCDFCGALIEEKGNDSPLAFSDKVYIIRSVGTYYPMVIGEDQTVDMCAHCFDTKFKPWLELHGVKVARMPWDAR